MRSIWFKLSVRPSELQPLRMGYMYLLNQPRTQHYFIVVNCNDCICTTILVCQAYVTTNHIGLGGFTCQYKQCRWDNCWNDSYKLGIFGMDFWNSVFTFSVRFSFSKNDSRPTYGFLHIPSINLCIYIVILLRLICLHLFYMLFNIS